MQNITETALLGAYHPLHNEIGALAAAVANPEDVEKIAQARKELVEKSNEHVLYDTAGIIGFFATITIVVDFTGHFSQDLKKLFDIMASIISSGRVMRQKIGQTLGLADFVK
mmetsp:Transcript_83656/g.116270  ORF Transcript_83656/g.116270 Transcript_83656/m.116270 type:complete len:112 (-) Transcript_83656:198-533(-)